MRKILSAALGAVAMLIGNSAFAQENVKGAGALTCAGFYEIFQSGTDAEKQQVVGLLFSWVQGYASGKNLDRVPAEQKDLRTMTPEYIVGEVDRYCAINANFEIYSISEIIYSGLPAFEQPNA